MKEENARIISGATREDSELQSQETLSMSLNVLSKYKKCPDEFKNTIKGISLENLVYWKFNENMEESNFKNEKDLLKNVIAEVERPLFSLTLKVTNGNQSKSAQLLGCNRNTLHRKLKEFSINPKEIKIKESKIHTRRKRRSLESQLNNESFEESMSQSLLNAKEDSINFHYKKSSLSDSIEV